MLFAPEISVFAQLSLFFRSQILIRGPRVKSHGAKYPPTSVIKFIYLFLPFVGTKHHLRPTLLFVK
jgi:hypothetical protein